MGVSTLGFQGVAFLRSIERAENRTFFISAFGPDDSSTSVIPKDLVSDLYNNYHVAVENNSNEIKLAELDSLGNVQAYRDLAIGAGSRKIGELASNGEDNVFVTGSFDTTAFIQKLNTSESIEWVSSLSDGATDSLIESFVSLDINSSQELYALGAAEDGNRSHTGYADKPCQDLLVVKYNSDGSVAWQKRIAGGIDSSTSRELSLIPYEIKLDNNNEIAVLAIAADWDGSNYTTEGRGLVVIKLSETGTNIWQEQFEQPSIDVTESAAGLSIETIYSRPTLSVDGFNNIYVFYTTQTGSVSTGLDTFAVLVKYSGDGTLIFQRTLSTQDKEVVSKDVKVSISGDVYLLVNNLTDKRNSILKILSNGTVSWERDLYLDDANFYTALTRINLDKFNNVMLAGTIVDGENERQAVVVKVPNDGSGIGTDTFKSRSFVYAVASLGVSTPTYKDFSPNYIVSDAALTAGVPTATLSESSTDKDKTIIFEAGV